MERCSKEEFEHWQAMYRLRPWGDEWQQAATVAWWAGNSGRMKKNTRIADLIPAAKGRRWVTDPAKFEKVFRLAFGG